MAEPERRLPDDVGVIRADEFLANQRHEVSADVGAYRLRRELRHRAQVEDLPHHRGPLDDLPLFALESVEARRQQRVDRRRDGDRGQVPGGDPVPVVSSQELVVDEHRQDLLHEQGVAFRGLGDPGLRDLRQQGPAQQVLHQDLAVRFGQRLELDGGGVVLPSTPTGADVEQLLPGDGDEKDRGTARPVGDVVDEIEERRLAPVDVVEHRHEPAPFGHRLQQLPEGPGDLLGGRRGLPQAEDLEEAVGHGFAIVFGQLGGELFGRGVFSVFVGDRRSLSDHLHDRPVRDAGTVGETSPLQDRRDVLDG